MTDTSPAAVQRYNAYNRSGDIASMGNVVNGQYVHYSDYAALSSKLDAANQRHAAALDAVARANVERDALVAAAYEAAASIQTHHYNTWKDKCEHPLDTTSQNIIRALTPAHATAALDRIKAEARDAAALEAVERARDAALVEASLAIANTNEVNKTRMERLILALRTQAPEPARVTVQEAAKVLADLAERRELPFYVVEMPLTKNGHGPAAIGIDATSVQYEVWDAADMTTLSKHKHLSDAIPAALRAIAGGRNE